VTHAPAVIVGGGISGLVCAYELRKAGVAAQLLEASPRLGGVIRSDRREGYLLEFGPQSFSGTPALLALCSELGINRELVEAPARAPRYVLVDGALQSVPLDPPALMMSSLLGTATKKNIARDLFGKSRPPEQDESVANFVRRKFSAEMLDKLVGPFVSGIFAGDPERLSLRSAFPQVYEAEKSAGSVIRGLKRASKSKKESKGGPTLFSFREGNATLIRTLQRKLGEAARVGVEVFGLKRGGAGGTFELKTRGSGQEETVTTDNVILSTPTDIAARLLREISADFDLQLGAIEYAPVAIVSLGYPRAAVSHSLNGFGFLVPRSAGRRILGSVWNSSLFPKRAPEGYVLLTCFVGGATDPQPVTQPETELAKIVAGELATILAIKEAANFRHVEIYRRALPQYNLGHSERIRAIERLSKTTPGLWLAGNYLRGPSVGACVEQAQAVARDALSRMKR
jgi:protoporphyrinogen/coproporphyrinogen III oxidase